MKIVFKAQKVFTEWLKVVEGRAFRWKGNLNATKLELQIITNTHHELGGENEKIYEENYKLFFFKKRSGRGYKKEKLKSGYFFY